MLNILFKKNLIPLKLELSELVWLGSDYLGPNRGSLLKVRVLILNVYIRNMMLSCSYLGHSGENVLFLNLQFKTKNGRK